MFEVVLLILFFVIVGAFFSKMGGAKIDGAQARELVSNGALLVDVRSTAEFQSGHIDGAKNIPSGEAEKRVSEFGAKDAPIVVYCRSGARSAAVKASLESRGFSNVQNLGGMHRW